MRYRMLTMVAAVGGLAIAGAATADGSVSANLDGEDLDLEGGSFTSLFDGPVANAFTGGDLRDIHAELNADGVATKRRVTFLVSETAEGMSIMTLVDSFWDSSNNTLQTLGLETTAPSGKGYRINDLADDMTMTEGAGGATADIAFNWRAGGGDGYSWTHLAEGDAVSFDLTWGGGTGLLLNNAIQFVSYTPDGWTVVDRAGFDENGEFGITFDAIPAPGALALLGLAGLISRRRRR